MHVVTCSDADHLKVMLLKTLLLQISKLNILNLIVLYSLLSNPQAISHCYNEHFKLFQNFRIW